MTTNVAPDPRVVTLHAMEHGLNEDAARRALMSGSGTGVMISTFNLGESLYEEYLGAPEILAAKIAATWAYKERNDTGEIATPDPGDSLHEECLATQDEPEISVTEEERRFPINLEMERIGRETLLSYGKTLNDAYRAMAALTPKDMFDASARDRAEAWANECMARRIAVLEAENAALLATIEMLDKRLGAAAFGASDLPDPPRRPDGTLVPQPKPWAPPKDAGVSRRIGS